jgi:hypothetical protein
MISVNNSPQYGPYVLCGWHVESAIPLPELTAWSGAQEWNAEGTIRIKLQESPLDDAGRGFCVNSEDGASLRVKGVAGFWVNPGADRVLGAQPLGQWPLVYRRGPASATSWIRRVLSKEG